MIETRQSGGDVSGCVRGGFRWTLFFRIKNSEADTHEMRSLTLFLFLCLVPGGFAAVDTSLLKSLMGRIKHVIVLMEENR